MTEEKPLSYTDRLIQKFQTEEQTNFEVDDVIKLIKEFKLEEDAKRKAKTDVVPVGKYKYKKVADVAKFDKQYLKWIMKQDWIQKYPEFVQETKKYL